MIYSRKSSVLSNDINSIFSRTFGNVGNVFNLPLNQLIKSIFANGEQGFAYDPNDLSTMFQDAAGTTPVTAVGQPVGLMLDKSKGLSLRAELATTSNVVSVPIGGTAYTTYPIANIQVGKPYRITFTVTNYAGSLDVGIAGPTTLWLDGLTVAVTSNNTVTCTRTFVGTSGVINLYTRSTNQCVFSNISVREVAGNHTYQTNAASRPLLQRNSTTGAYYLTFDGTDDFLVTSSINFTATDKISLFAGVRKLSDASVGTIVELSAIKNSNNGVFALFAPGTSTSPDVTWASKGTVERLNTVANIAAPYSFVATGFGSIVNKVSNLRINGIANANNAGDQGTGNYGNYPLYIGRRGGTSLPFNGHIYGLIGVGKLASDGETAAIEKELAKRLGVTLSV